MKIVIIGASGFGKEVLDILRHDPDNEVVGFIDKNEELFGSKINGVPVLGNDALLAKLSSEGVSSAVVAIGDFRVRRKLFDLASGYGYKLINVIHTSACISQSAELGRGIIIYGGVVINTNVHIGDNVLLNSGATIGHDTKVESDVNINPGVDIAGRVLIKRGAYIGISASIIENITIGEGSIVGAGAVVIRDVPDNVVATGVPAEVIKQI